MNDTKTAAAATTDVGVAIARKQQHQQQQQQQQQQQLLLLEQQQQQLLLQRKKQSKPTRRTWWSDLLQGSALYGLCIILPTAVAPLASIYPKWIAVYITTPLSRILTQAIGAQAEWTDVGIIVVLSLSLAMLRIAIVHWVGDMSGSEQVEAMVRCKSILLLSSSYQDSLTPTNNKRTTVRLDPLDMPPPMPSLTRSDSWLELAEHTWGQVTEQVEQTWEVVRRSSVTALGVQRLHAAPRYATAVFQCLFSSWMILLALAWFRTSNFWPPLLGGHGSTGNCWSLKGGVALDESFDFDELDAKLKFYFLVQASYHLHSGAFHILAKSILWYHQQKAPTPRLQSPKSYTSYWRSLLQHGIALLLILGSHLFSATRRLGAVGSFCLDVSSIVLHGLQVCINHPRPFPPTVLQHLHRWVVIPVFVLMRFYMWPCCVWYSAAFESKAWLQQMESTMIPGMAKAMYLLFHVLTLALLSLNLILMKRLLYHPHLKRLMEEGIATETT
jgi:hypothetical protein